MMWVFAVLIVLAMGGVAMLAAGHGEPMAPAYDDRPDALVPAHRPLASTDLRKVRFSLAFRGYRMSEVDALLARLATEMEAGPGAHPGGAHPGAHPGAADVVGTPAPEPPEDLPPVREVAERWAVEQPAGPEILDFSTESVDQVESLLDQWSMKRGSSSAEDNEDVWAAGAYVGEILVRAVPGAAWSRHAVFGEVPVVLMPSGRYENPIGKAMNRYEGDEGDSIAFFLDAALADERGADVDS